MQPFGENPSNIPAFLGKLWKMVNDPNTDHLISWSQSGTSFIIQNQAQFWYELLPSYYKHNNMSSFVRQLNMYGFHKMSTVENGTMDTDKDEIQFCHTFFQKGHPELLQNIKRKVTVGKSEKNVQNVLKYEDLSQVFSDVKVLHGRQSNVDSQLSSIKQENAVLWRELAILRQKHLKQQQIVNKLIQFLVTLVQPSPSSRMGVSVKRRMPLMLHESPAKKIKNKKTLDHTNIENEKGLIIHELDNEIEISPEDLLDQQLTETEALVTSPVSTSSSCSIKSPSNENPNAGLPQNIFSDVDPSEFVSRNPSDAPQNIGNLQSTSNQSCEKEVFLNPMGGNALLSNLANGSYNSAVINNKSGKKIINKANKTNSNSFLVVDNDEESDSRKQVATRINKGDDLDLHVENTQNEIDQLKDILRGCNGVDANTLLGNFCDLQGNFSKLFNDDSISYELPYNFKDTNKDNNQLDPTSADPLVAGTELTTYGNNLIDFNELFDDDFDTNVQDDSQELTVDSTVNTPLVLKNELIFPNVNKDL